VDHEAWRGGWRQRGRREEVGEGGGRREDADGECGDIKNV